MKSGSAIAVMLRCCLFGGCGTASLTFSVIAVRADVSGFGNTGVNWSLNPDLQGSPSVASNVLTITDGGGNEARSAFFNIPQDVGKFTASFIYQASNYDTLYGTYSGGDGFTFTIQSAGANAVGTGGGDLGYGGAEQMSSYIPSSVALAFNLFQYPGFRDRGEQLWTGGASSFNYNPTTSVDMHSQHPIAVQLNYNGKIMSESLRDTITQGVYNNSYTVDIPSVIGRNTAYVGFTGGTGNASSKQTISNFALKTVPKLQWNFNDFGFYEGRLPPGWTQDDTNGYWSIQRPRYFSPNDYDDILGAIPNPPAPGLGQTRGAGSEQEEIRLDVYTPPFRITDVSNADLLFAISGANPFNSTADGFEVSLVDVNKIPLALLWQWEFPDYSGPPPVPVHLASLPVADQIDENTVYRLRLRFHDNDLNLNSTLAVELANLSLTGAVSVLAGDYNGNGIVDAADYTAWRDSRGSTTNLAADGNGDHVVNQLDYDFWKANFGAVSSGSGASTVETASVPEPSTIALAAFFAIISASRKAGQKRQLSRL